MWSGMVRWGMLMFGKVRISRSGAVRSGHVRLAVVGCGLVRVMRLGVVRCD